MQTPTLPIYNMSDLDKLERLISQTSATSWRIESKDGRKRAEHEGENVQEAIHALQDRYEHLSPGRYTLKYRRAGKTANSADHEDFEVLKQNQAMQTNNSHHAQQNYQNPYAEYADLLRRLIELELKFHYFEKDIEKRFTDLEKVFKDLSDDDPDNDESAMDKFGKILETAPKITSAIKSFRNA